MCIQKYLSVPAVIGSHLEGLEQIRESRRELLWVQLWMGTNISRLKCFISVIITSRGLYYHHHHHHYNSSFLLLLEEVVD